jgi:flavodoxin I
MGKIHELLQNKGVQFVGEWPADEYDFTTSRAAMGENLVGLALDEDNEPDLTDYRLKNWVKLIAPLLQ